MRAKPAVIVARSGREANSSWQVKAKATRRLRSKGKTSHLNASKPPRLQVEKAVRMEAESMEKVQRSRSIVGVKTVMETGNSL